VAAEELKDEEQRWNGADREQQKRLERAEGKKRSTRKNLRVVVTLSTTNSTRIAVGQRAFKINMIIRILIFCCPRECRVLDVNLAAHLHLVSNLFFFSTYALQPSRLIVGSGLDVPTFATRRLHAAEGRTVGEKCPRILPNMQTSTLHLGIFYMP